MPSMNGAGAATALNYGTTQVEPVRRDAGRVAREAWETIMRISGESGS